jgi:SAM-dependent methyltransferase
VESDPGDLVAEGYDGFYSAWGKSPTLKRLWQEHASGGDFPEEFDHISFLTLSQLTSLSEGLALSPGQLLVDLACGAGGPGLWVAYQSGCRLVGIDQSSVGVTRAIERAARVGLSERATFAPGTFAATSLESSSVDAVMTVDALQYAPDKIKAVDEIARILKPGGRFGFLLFELDPSRVEGLPLWEDPVPDYRPLLEGAGFEMLNYEQVPNWWEQVVATYQAVLAERDTLEAELGVTAAAGIAMEAAATIGLEPYCGHVFGLAVRS